MDFLIETQIVGDMFVPIGTKGWYRKNRIRALYDQQPIEASCMVEATLTALNSSSNENFKKNGSNCV